MDIAFKEHPGIYEYLKLKELEKLTEHQLQAVLWALTAPEDGLAFVNDKLKDFLTLPLPQ